MKRSVFFVLIIFLVFVLISVSVFASSPQGNVILTASAISEDSSDNDLENNADEEYDSNLDYSLENEDSLEDYESDEYEEDYYEESENQNNSNRSLRRRNFRPYKRREFRGVINPQGEEEVVRVEIEREVEIEDGEVIVEISRKFIYENGTEIEQEWEIIYDEESNVSRKLRARLGNESFRRDLEVEIEDGIEVEEGIIENETKIRARLRNGNFVYIYILPEQALERARERFRLRQELMENNDSNFSLELKERTSENVSRVFYEIEADKPGKFLGLFRTNFRMNAEVDVETGEVIRINRPWWAFLVAEESYEETDVSE